MYGILVGGIAFNLAVVACNYAGWIGLRTGKRFYLLLSGVFLMLSMAFSGFIGFLVVQGLSSSEFGVLALTFLVLLLGLPLMFWSLREFLRA